MAFEKGGILGGTGSAISTVYRSTRPRPAPRPNWRSCGLGRSGQAGSRSSRLGFRPLLHAGRRNQWSSFVALDISRGVQKVDKARKQITVAGGTRINEVGKTLKQHGLSLINQGDIDSQAVAGAFTTGTHGTGIKLGNMASSIAGMRIVKANGEILDIDGSDEELLHAAQVSVGTLVIISSMTLNVMDAYNLHERLWRLRLRDLHGAP